MAKTKRGTDEPTIIKKYANRRLYDTGRSSYVTLDDLCEMVKDGYDFVVLDAKSGEDITRSILTQIIVDQESKGEENLLPIGFLRKLIGFYGDNVQSAIPSYLEGTLDVFIKNQELVREQVNKSLEGIGTMPCMFSGHTNLEDMNRQNMIMFERTMKMFTPFGIQNSNEDEQKDKEEA